MTIPLFTDDQIPACDAGPIHILRRLEAKLAELKAENAADQREIDERRRNADRQRAPEEWHHSDPALCPWCRQDRRMLEITEIEAKLPAAQEAALAVVNAHKETDR